MDVSSTLASPKLRGLFDHPKEECGVVGVYTPGEEASRLAFFGLFALQHRGQESAGIAATNGESLNVHSAMGLAAQVFRERDFYPLAGEFAIGHTRYSTTGTSQLRNAQPLLVDGHHGQLALAHNGGVTNSRQNEAPAPGPVELPLHVYHRLGDNRLPACQRTRSDLGGPGLSLHA